MKRLLLTTIALVLACTSTPQPVATTEADIPRNPEFKNVQVLPHTMTHDELINVMKHFNQSLGVRCDFCHVQTATSPEPQFDFPLDTKEPKRVARVMIQMTHQIGGPWMERIEAAEGHAEEKSVEAEKPHGAELPPVNCWTCHRGKTEPEMPPPAAKG